MKATFLLAAMAITGAVANTMPSLMGIEISEVNGEISVREVPKALDKRACTNCVHVGGCCKLGEGNCYTSEHGSCTYCANRGGTICVDTDGGSCKDYPGPKC